MHPKDLLPSPNLWTRAKKDADFYKKWIQRELIAVNKHFADMEKRQREHELRRKTLRINDGSNQCLPPSAWMTLADRIAN